MANNTIHIALEGFCVGMCRIYFFYFSFFLLYYFISTYTHTCVTPQSGNQVSTSLGNSGLCWTVFARTRVTAVPAEWNGDLQTLICVLVAGPRRCLTLSNPVPWQNWMAAYLGYTLRMTTLFCGWPIMVNDTHTRRRRWCYHRRRFWHATLKIA